MLIYIGISHSHKSTNKTLCIIVHYFFLQYPLHLQVYSSDSMIHIWLYDSIMMVILRDLLGHIQTSNSVNSQDILHGALNTS